MNDRNIVITGFMGTGKTTAGQLVAAQLKREFVDTDAHIERHAGLAVPEIFASQGEAAFRYMERRLCRFLAAQRGLVIATGGGMLVDPGNLAVMRASGLVVCLTASPEAIRARLADESGGRPLLQADWLALLEQRRPAYAAIPVQIDTTHQPPEQVAQEIMQRWQQFVSP